MQNVMHIHGFCRFDTLFRECCLLDALLEHAISCGEKYRPIEMQNGCEWERECQLLIVKCWECLHLYLSVCLCRRQLCACVDVRAFERNIDGRKFYVLTAWARCISAVNRLNRLYRKCRKEIKGKSSIKQHWRQQHQHRQFHTQETEHTKETLKHTMYIEWLCIYINAVHAHNYTMRK